MKDVSPGPHRSSSNKLQSAPRKFSGQLSAAATAFLVLSCLSAFGAPPAGLNQNARDEITALLQEKASWTPAQQKLESALIHALKKSRGQPFAPRAKNLRLDLQFQSDGRVLVDISAQVTPDLLKRIQRGGGTVIASFPQFHAVRAILPLTQVEALAGLPEVLSIRRADQASTHTGSVDSQGDTTHLADAARNAFGVSGAGVKVGVLSDSDDYLADAQNTGDLGNVTVLPGQSGVPGSGEGTAMMEIVADLAPDAQLYFATAFHGQASFAQNILDLRTSGCDIIIDDVGYFNESPFQDGVIAQAVNTVTASGALYFSSAGNSGNKDAGTSGTWEGDFADAGAVSFPEFCNLHSFGPATYDTVITNGSSRHVDLFWSDPLGNASDDYDVFVLDSTGSSVLRSSTTRQNGSSDPYEYISTLNVGEQIVIVKYSGDARFLHLDTGRARLAISTSGCTAGHSAATNAFSVAAVSARTAYPNAFTGGSANPPETFTSDGPRHVFFSVNSTPITPGNFSSTGGAIRQKPDIAAADGVSTTLPASGLNPFFGTSAAAPHAGAIAALLLSYNHALTPAQVRTVLTTTALDIGPPGVDRDSGAGIVMAYQALTNLARVTPPGIVTPPADQTVAAAGTATFNVTAVGSTPLGYFWRRNGAPIVGAYTATYSTNNVQVSDSGSQFSCVVSNSSGSVTSSIATLTVVVPLSNDQCGGATTITGSSYSNTQSTTNATSTGDPVPSCGDLLNGVWYKYSPPTSGKIVVDTIGSDFDTVLALYTGLCGSLTQAACDDDSGGNTTSRITNAVSAGPTYYILAGGYGGVTGNMPLHLAFTATALAPVIIPDALSLVTEACPNGAVDPGETVTVSFGLKNIGNAATTNLVATLLATGGITAPSGAQTYGALAAGATAAQPFTFIAMGVCGGTNLATVQLQDGAANLGAITFNLVLGQTGNAFAEYFDSVTSPALPNGWTTSATGAGVPWVTTNSVQDTPPNSVFSASASSAGVADLVSPVIPIPPAEAQLSFSHYYDVEQYYDGGLLEIKIGGGAFTNIPAAGGAYLTNGPDTILDSSTGNPLGGQLGWSGTSPGFITTIVSLPPAASGQNIQFRWRCASDSDIAYLGWFVDTVTLSAPGCCANLPSITTQPQNQAVPSGGSATFNVAAAGSAPLIFQWRFNETNLAGASSTNYTRSNVQPGDTGSYDVVITNFVGSVTSSVATLAIVSQPILLSPGLATNGTYTFILSGNTGYNYAILGTTNLSNWYGVATLTNATGQVPFIETNPPSSPFRAYRAKLLP